MNILKFGGSSLASPSKIKSVSEIIKTQLKEGTTIVVFSAFGGVTNDLLYMADLASREDLSYKDILLKNESIDRKNFNFIF